MRTNVEKKKNAQFAYRFFLPPTQRVSFADKRDQRRQRRRRVVCSSSEKKNPSNSIDGGDSWTEPITSTNKDARTAYVHNKRVHTSTFLALRDGRWDANGFFFLEKRDEITALLLLFIQSRDADMKRNFNCEMTRNKNKNMTPISRRRFRIKINNSHWPRLAKKVERIKYFKQSVRPCSSWCCCGWFNQDPNSSSLHGQRQTPG